MFLFIETCNNKEPEINMKKAALFLICTLIAANSLTAEGQQEKETLKIGISQFVQHPALDAVAKGIMEEMAVLGYENVEYDYQNSNADVGTAKQIADLFKSKKMDMVVGIATPNAQALKMTIRDVPVIYSAISDPVSAGLVDSLTEGEAGITGTSHQTPVKEQLEFLMSLTDVKVLGQVYTGNEDNAMFHAKSTEIACKELGLEYVGTSITSSAEVKSATESLMGRVDAIYVATDNTVVSALSGLAATAMENNVPVLSADPASARENPVLAAWGFDWYYVGQLTAQMMDQVLQGSDTKDLPTGLIRETDKMELILNTAVAEKIGIELPQEYLDKASLIITE